MGLVLRGFTSQGVADTDTAAVPLTEYVMSGTQHSVSLCLACLQKGREGYSYLGKRGSSQASLVLRRE